MHSSASPFAVGITAAQSKNLFSNIEKQRLKTKPSLLPGLFCAQKALDAECNDSNIEKKAS